MKTIIFNGPPSCGKSEAVMHTVNKLHTFTDYDVARIRMADPLYNALRELFSLEMGEWEDMYNNAKEEPSEQLWGMSPRQAMIWLSEDVMKPKFGKTFFGDIAGLKAMEWFTSYPNGIVLCDDGGFDYEVRAYKDLLPKHHQLFIIRICRDGCNFSNDSRGYLIEDAFGGVKEWITLDNRFDSVVDYREEVDRIVDHILRS